MAVHAKEVREDISEDIISKKDEQNLKEYIEASSKDESLAEKVKNKLNEYISNDPQLKSVISEEDLENSHKPIEITEEDQDNLEKVGNVTNNPDTANAIDLDSVVYGPVHKSEEEINAALEQNKEQNVDRKMAP